MENDKNNEDQLLDDPQADSNNRPVSSRVNDSYLSEE